MKRFFLAIMTMALAITANAETTDVSAMDNVLYINETTVEAGKQAKLSVRMKNTAKVQTIGVYVKLPEGVTVATNSRGMLMINLSTERTDSECHTLSKSLVDGFYRVGILGTAGYEFDGNDGEVFTITVNVDENMIAGDYTIEMTEMELTDTDNKSYNTESVKTTLTVNSTATGIAGAAIDGEANAVYNVAGQAQQNVRRGINVVQTSNGVRKMVKK